jgi:hypothetical protein
MSIICIRVFFLFFLWIYVLYAVAFFFFLNNAFWCTIFSRISFPGPVISAIAMAVQSRQSTTHARFAVRRAIDAKSRSEVSCLPGCKHAIMMTIWTPRINIIWTGVLLVEYSCFLSSYLSFCVRYFALHLTCSLAVFALPSGGRICPAGAGEDIDEWQCIDCHYKVLSHYAFI